MNYIIIGYSVAAVNAIKSIRSLDSKGKIYVISEEEKLYSRPLISYYLAGKIKEDEMNFVEGNFDTKYNLKVYYSEVAKSIDFDKKLVYLYGNKKLSYDKLLITTGGVPVIPDIKGYKSYIEGIFTFTKLDDAKNLLNYIKRNKINQAVILGGGLIGMKAAEGLLAHNIKLKIIDITDRLLANTFDKEASCYIEKKLNQHGSEFISNNTIVEIFSKNKKLESVKLKDNKKINTKLLIIAVGVKPNIEIVYNTKMKTNKGILVDEFMNTNLDDVFSAGDVVETKNFITQENSVIAIWPAAAVQGRVAGLNMVDKKFKYDGMFGMNSVEILGVSSISFGLTNVQQKDGFEILVKKDSDYYKKIVIKDNKVVGVILVGNIERGGIYGMLIKQKIDVSSFKNELLRDDFGFLILPKDFRKHLVLKEYLEV